MRARASLAVRRTHGACVTSVLCARVLVCKAQSSERGRGRGEAKTGATCLFARFCPLLPTFAHFCPLLPPPFSQPQHRTQRNAQRKQTDRPPSFPLFPPQTHANPRRQQPPRIKVGHPRPTPPRTRRLTAARHTLRRPPERGPGGPGRRRSRVPGGGAPPARPRRYSVTPMGLEKVPRA